jgi:hypothetical protein
MESPRSPHSWALSCYITFRVKLMQQSDQEILQVLKETLRQKKNGELIEPDDLIAEGIIKWALAASVMGIVALVFLPLFEYEVPSLIRQVVDGPIGSFSVFLFLHLNNKAKNTSSILFVLTWVSIMFGYYF